MWLALICQKLGRFPSRPLASSLSGATDSSVSVGTCSQASPREGVWDTPEMAKLAAAPGWSAGQSSGQAVCGGE